jgi:L-alanine-DL-glutamate epimerase-like enolase superfamily enzyme
MIFLAVSDWAEGVLVKITDAKMMVSSPGRNFVTLKVSTDEGIFGLGDATLNGRELAVASYLQNHLIPAAIHSKAKTSGSTSIAARTGGAAPLP